MTVAALVQFIEESASSLATKALQLATALELPVTSWRDGDPTLTLLTWLCNTLADRDTIVATLAKSAFLDSAEGEWLHILALDLYGVDYEPASYATTTVTLENSGGGYYSFDPGDVTVSVTATGKTYHNTEAFTLSAGATASAAFVADEPGSDSSVGVGEIDSLDTTYLGVAVLNNTAGIGIDEEADEALRERCRETLGALSPNGPSDAYSAVAKNSALTGVTGVTRVAVDADQPTGLVNVYLAGPSGALEAGPIAAVQAALDVWAVPLATTVTAIAATELEASVALTISGTDLPGTYATDIANAITSAFAAAEGGDVITITSVESLVYELLVGAGASRVSVVVTSLAGSTEDLEVPLESVPVLPGPPTITVV